MKHLYILNDPPYGTERSYNGLRCANRGQSTPDGYYNLQKMLRVSENRDCSVAVCGSCIDARGIDEDQLANVARRGSMKLLAEWKPWADQVIVC